MEPKIPTIIAKTVLLTDDGKVLLLRRSSTDLRRPLEWDFPGGRIEKGELIEQGATREISEESGIMIESDQLQLLTTATQTYDDEATVIRFLFKTYIPSNNEVRLSFEHNQYKWVDVDTALELFPHPFYGAGLRYARDNKLL